MWGKKKKAAPKKNLIDGEQQENTVDTRDHKSSTNKIINNEYYSKDVDTRSISFSMDPFFESEGDAVDQLHFELLFKDIQKTVAGSEFEKYIENPDLRLNKSEINKVYHYITKKLPDYTKKDLFSQISEYFDIDYHKFFNSLSNMFKEELIQEINGSSYYKKKKINRLF